MNHPEVVLHLHDDAVEVVVLDDVPVALDARKVPHLIGRNVERLAVVGGLAIGTLGRVGREHPQLVERKRRAHTRLRCGHIGRVHRGTGQAEPRLPFEVGSFGDILQFPGGKGNGSDGAHRGKHEGTLALAQAVDGVQLVGAGVELDGLAVFPVKAVDVGEEGLGAVDVNKQGAVITAAEHRYDVAHLVRRQRGQRCKTGAHVGPGRLGRVRPVITESVNGMGHKHNHLAARDGAILCVDRHVRHRHRLDARCVLAGRADGLPRGAAIAGQVHGIFCCRHQHRRVKRVNAQVLEQRALLHQGSVRAIVFFYCQGRKPCVARFKVLQIPGADNSRRGDKIPFVCRAYNLTYLAIRPERHCRIRRQHPVQSAVGSHQKRVSLVFRLHGKLRQLVQRLCLGKRGGGRQK